MFGITLSAIASLSFIILACYVVMKKRTASNIALSFAIITLASIEFIDQYALHFSVYPVFWKHITIFLEALLPATFLFLSLTYGRQGITGSVSRWWWYLIALAVLFPVGITFFAVNDLVYSPDFQTEKILFLGVKGYWFYMGLMLYCILALINLENTFSSASGSDRWKMKFEVMGLSSILAVLIFYYSQGLLYKIINMNLLPTRAGIFILASLLIGYSRIFRGNDIKVEVSRYILYRSLTLVIVGIYLVGLGLIGESMRYFNIPFSNDLTVFVAFAFGIVLFLILLSEKLRRKAKVLISRHFYKHKHDYREAWLKYTDKLSLCKTLHDVHMAVLTAFRETFGLEGASLYVFAKGRNRYVLAAELSMSYAPVDFQPSASLLADCIDRDIIVNPCAEEYAPSSEESLFLDQIKARLIVPLIFNKKMEGFVVFKKQLVDEDFTFEDYDLMKTLSKQAAQSIVTYKLSEELIETREVAAVAKLSSFVLHDIKNLTYSISLILNNAETLINTPEFQSDMIESLRNTVSKMKHLIQKLKTIPEKHALNTGLADMDILAQEVVTDIMKMKPAADIVYNGTSALASVDAEEIKKVILNLVVNALDAAGEEGAITIETGTNGRSVCLKVRDNGSGMTDDFLKNHLFKPFRTTKEKGLGIGLYQCRQVIEAHGGIIEAESILGKGTVLTVHLPLAENIDYAFHRA
jgi:putative PEP-CTERM system histidine kinase